VGGPPRGGGRDDKTGEESKMARPKAIDWSAIADLVCQILEEVRVERKGLQKVAAQRGVTLEQLMGAAITQAIRERLAG
jgi:hypothetical protein